MSHKGDPDPKEELVPDTYGYEPRPSYGDNDIGGNDTTDLFDIIQEVWNDFTEEEFANFSNSLLEAWGSLGLSLKEIQNKLKLAELLMAESLQLGTRPFITVTSWRVIDYQAYVENLMNAYPDMFSIDLPAGSDIGYHVKVYMHILRKLIGSTIKVPKTVVIMGQTITDDTEVLYEDDEKQVTVLDFILDELFLMFVVFIIAKITYLQPNMIIYAMVTGYKLIREDEAVSYIKDNVEPLLQEMNNRLIGMSNRITAIEDELRSLSAYVGYKMRFL